MKFRIELDSSTLKDPLLILKLIAIIFLAIILFYFKVDIVDAIIAFYFLIAILFFIKSQYSFYLGLFFLILAAFLQIIGNAKVAEDYAIYAFYFLFIGTIVALIELVKKRN